jgi:hypothetical protein
VKPGRLLAIAFTGALVFSWVWLGFGRSQAAARTTTVTALKLYDAYDTNEASADQAYKGATLVVSGNVDRISNDPDDVPYVTLMTNSSTRRVVARFPEETRKEVTRLYRRQWISVSCRGAGMQSDVLLNDCRLEKNQ